MTVATFDLMGHWTPEADLDALRWLADSLPQCYAAVEVGTWAGLTALTLAEKFAYVYCVDHWQPKGDSLEIVARDYPPDVAFKTFCRNLRDVLLERVFPCRGSSLEWAAVWPFPVDLIFLDADHRYEAIASDIAAWRRHVRKGGVMCGHDYQRNFDGVVRAVNEAFGTRVQVLGDAVWWTRIP